MFKKTCNTCLAKKKEKWEENKLHNSDFIPPLTIFKNRQLQAELEKNKSESKKNMTTKEQHDECC